VSALQRNRGHLYRFHKKEHRIASLANSCDVEAQEWVLTVMELSEPLQSLSAFHDGKDRNQIIHMETHFQTN